MNTLAANLVRFGKSFRSEPKASLTAPESLVGPEPKDYTVLVYADGRDGLAPSTLRALNELEAVGSSERVNLVAQVTSQASLRDRHLAQLGAMPTRTYYLQHDESEHVTSPVVREQSQASLEDFVRWGVEKFPAKHYVLIIKQHGMGFSASGKAPMSARQMNAQLERALGDKKLDVIAMDSCQMMQTEVGYQLRGRAEVLTGSPESIWAREYPYRTLAGSIERLAQLPAESQTGARLGQIITRIHEKEVPQGIQTAVDLGAMQKFGGSLQELVDTIVDHKVSPERVYTQLMRSQSLDPGHMDSISYNFRDLGSFLKGLHQDEQLPDQVRAKAAEARQNLQHTTLAHYISDKWKSVKTSTGPTAYLPWAHPGQASLDSYQNLDFARDTGWDKLIDYVFSGAPQPEKSTGSPLSPAKLALRTYKQFIAPYDSSACPYTPSCSQYAREAVETHGLIEGGQHALMRLVGCSGPGGGGADPVPPAHRDDHAHHHHHH
ncbi:MAG: membrane protein insertion efficiency factor YidD, partial [Candidatus Eremiobacteraeota bacterium]|nr:membrane protein insertion efficiency factor YidD [Candidatus Eremiobacteraeota bacterium]